MQLKKTFEKPEIEVIRFDMKDVITDSPYSFKTNGVYNFNDFKNEIKG